MVDSTSHVSQSPILEVHRLTSSYIDGGMRLTALTDLSFTLNDEEFVAVIGPSGSGKSTLLDIIAGLLAPDSGTVSLAGELLTAERRLGRSAYMRQRDLLMPWRTAVDNAALALEINGVPRRLARATALERFPAFGLEGFAGAYPAQLSGGMRQRVAFLRTLLTGQPLLLLDEPFAALDALTRAMMRSWLLDLWERERRAVLLVTHDVDEAIFLADRVVVLTPRPGRITHVEPVPLPRPRARTIVTTPVFTAAKAAVLAALGEFPLGPD